MTLPELLKHLRELDGKRGPGLRPDEWAAYSVALHKAAPRLIRAGELLEKARHLLELRKRFPDYTSSRMTEHGAFKMTGSEESLYEEIRALMDERGEG